MSQQVQDIGVTVDFQHYRKAVAGLRTGKRLPDAVYLGRALVEEAPAELRAAIEAARRLAAASSESHNVIKLFARDYRVSLLSYESFDASAFPALVEAVTVDLTLGKVRRISYAGSDNPPIIHRKELLVASDDPRVPEWRALTESAEAAGLFANTKRIGFRKNWERLLREKRLRLQDGKLRPDEDEAAAPAPIEESEVQRHRTAISRSGLSTPSQSLADNGFFDRKLSFFDYGCGRGEDVAELKAHGVQASGWDPAFAPDEPKCGADVVNLGFVINVIEDPGERAQAVIEAYGLARRLLVVSAMLGGESITSKFDRYGDGIRTKRNTFQKYYRQAELREYIEDLLEVSAIAVGPGLFYVFRDPIEEQLFLERRNRVRRDWRMLTQRVRQSKPKVETKTVLERHASLAEDFWLTCLELGRIPARDEFEHLIRLRSAFGSVKKAFELIAADRGLEVFEAAREARRGDLRAYFALEQFRRRKPFTTLPESQQRDIKELFAGYRAAQDEARDLLFSVGSPEVIHTAAQEAHHARGLGYLDGSHSLTVHSSLVGQLPEALRVFVGCGAQLYGDISGADLVKVHLTSGKVTLLYYDGFEKRALPLLKQRVKIKLRDREVDFFEYGGEFPEQPLYLKSRYIPSDFARFEDQRRFDRKLEELGLDFEDHGPRYADFLAILEANGLRVSGFRLIRARAASNPNKR